jgi:hypothetical protein
LFVQRETFLSFFFVVVLVLAGCGVSEPTVPYERVAGQGNVHFIYVNESYAQKSAYREIADYICSRERICIVMFWNDRAQVPLTLPMTDAQVDAKTAHYNLNKNTGLDRLVICAVDGC